MAERKFAFAVDEYYHIYNRGVDKRDIFCDEADRERFFKLLFLANGTKPFAFRDLPKGVPYLEIDVGECIIALGAYCLMPNHFHLLVRETVEGGISRFLEKMATSYSKYFNKKYERSGRLFEGTFKATHVNNDNYLEYLFSYIHLNPIKLINSGWKDNINDKEKSFDYLKKYKYSSFVDYLGQSRPESKIINRKAFPNYFETAFDFENYINDWISIKSECAGLPHT